MLDAVILYSLAVYMVFHVVGRSDILAKPRGWVFRTLPGWLIYPFTCALCFTFWLTLIGNLFGFIQTDLVVALSAPVVNMVLDLIVKALIRVNEPPVMGEGKTIWEGSTGLSTWRAPNVVVGTCMHPVAAGQMVQVAFSDGVKIPESARYAHLPANKPFRWESLDQWLKIAIPAANVTGDDMRGYAYPVVQKAWEAARERGEPIPMLRSDAPFNPLDHEQSK